MPIKAAIVKVWVNISRLSIYSPFDYIYSTLNWIRSVYRVIVWFKTEKKNLLRCPAFNLIQLSLYILCKLYFYIWYIFLRLILVPTSQQRPGRLLCEGVPSGEFRGEFTEKLKQFQSEILSSLVLSPKRATRSDPLSLPLKALPNPFKEAAVSSRPLIRPIVLRRRGRPLLCAPFNFGLLHSWGHLTETVTEGFGIHDVWVNRGAHNSLLKAPERETSARGITGLCRRDKTTPHITFILRYMTNFNWSHED